jgi:hypothetical protein
MNAIVTNLDVPTEAGTPFGGGFYVGRFVVNGDVYASVVAPKASGETSRTIWLPTYTEIVGADSLFDGFGNTRAMAEAGSEVAKWALGLDIDGQTDWYLPARDELELLYRHLKPTDDENYVYRHGENPSSLPPGYPYTIHLPGQTPVELFRTDGAEALEPAWYWTSTQYSAGGAWGQYFDDGSQVNALKDYPGRARAVRRIKIS